MFGNTLQNSHQIYCIEAETGELPILVPAQYSSDPVSERDKWILPEATALTQTMYTIPRVMLTDAVTAYREPDSLRIGHLTKLIITLVLGFFIIVTIIYIVISFPART
jgi:uncharacterized membrane-anchored protein